MLTGTTDAPFQVERWSVEGMMESGAEHVVELGGSFPTPDVPIVRPSTRAELDRAVSDVARRKEAWRQTNVRARAALLTRCIETTYAVAAEWVAHDLRERQIPPDAGFVGLDWLLGPAFIIRNLRELRESLLEIARLGHPRPPGPIRTRPDGTLTVGIFPRHPVDHLILPGYSSEVWMQPGVTAENLTEHMASAYRPGVERPAEVCAVLGAGNISALAPNDALYHLFVETRVVVLKVSPVLDGDAPFLERAFAPLIEAGIFRLVHGGADEARYLAHHPDVDVVQLTGTDKTYDALLFGTGPDAERRKAADDPLLTKPVRAECGVVTPVIVVPGEWTAHELELEAENILSSFVINAGQTCVTPRVLVTPRRWQLRTAFLDAVRRVLAKAPTRFPFHPGAAQRIARFIAAHPDAERIGAASGDRVPWLLITGLDPTNPHELAFDVDPFCGILSETALDVPGTAADFLDAATRFCNERLWGTLNAMLVVHPRSLRDGTTRAAYERALTHLRYGNIVVNAGPGLPYLLTSPPWGAHPGHTRTNIGSGIGVVHNTFLLEDTLKSVSRAPFRQLPKPPWYITNRRQREILEAQTTWDATHDARALLRLLWLGVRG